MTDMEVACMVSVLVLMSAEHFDMCSDYVKRTNMFTEERRFMERVIFIAGMKRKERVLL